ncbi:hypothetical protein ACODT5_27025 [Streptomyces sp. 5.8]|uniref:hypothetical protein n=1 Tax=Streptomyces sp. 5.8 TaxID=3406571 RepID=UPI003BB5F530
MATFTPDGPVTVTLLTVLSFQGQLESEHTARMSLLRATVEQKQQELNEIDQRLQSLVEASNALSQAQWDLVLAEGDAAAGDIAGSAIGITVTREGMSAVNRPGGVRRWEEPAAFGGTKQYANRIPAAYYIEQRGDTSPGVAVTVTVTFDGGSPWSTVVEFAPGETVQQVTVDSYPDTYGSVQANLSDAFWTGTDTGQTLSYGIDGPTEESRGMSYIHRPGTL